MLASHRPWLAGQPQGGLKYSSQSWLEIMSRFIALLAGKWVEHSLAMQDFYQAPPFRTIFDSTYYLLCTICSYILILQYSTVTLACRFRQHVSRSLLKEC